MTADEIRKQYQQVAAQVGDLFFQRERLEGQLDQLNASLDKLRETKDSLEKAFAEAQSASSPSSAAQDTVAEVDSNAVAVTAP